MSTFLNQPKGMFVIGCTEIFERLSFYTFVALLVLYASASVAEGGLGWTKAEALLLMGKFTLAVFTLPLLGGFIADRYIGPYRAAILGGIMIAAGHASILFSHHGLFYFYTGLILVVCGTGFFTPSTPTLLGRLYTPDDPRRVGGFNLYYMAINIGGLIAGFLAGILLSAYGYRIALSAAGVSMTLGLCVFILGKKHLVTNFTKKLSASEKKQDKPLTSTHKKAIFYLFVSFIFYAIWAIVYNLVISGTLTIYIEYFTQKTVFGYDIPTTFFSSLESIGIVVFAPIVSFLLVYAAKKKRPIHFFTQMLIGLILTFIAIAYFTHLTQATEVVQEGGSNAKPFHYLGIGIFILMVSLSELLISPVAMAAISVLSPPKYSSSFQALNLSIIGAMGLVSSKIGIMSLEHPYRIFYNLSVITLIGVLTFLVLNHFMVKAAKKAAIELEKNTKQHPAT